MYWLYVFANGEIRQSNTPPTMADRVLIGMKLLRVIVHRENGFLAYDYMTPIPWAREHTGKDHACVCHSSLER